MQRGKKRGVTSPNNVKRNLRIIFQNILNRLKIHWKKFMWRKCMLNVIHVSAKLQNTENAEYIHYTEWLQGKSNTTCLCFSNILIYFFPRHSPAATGRKEMERSLAWAIVCCFLSLMQDFFSLLKTNRTISARFLQYCIWISLYAIINTKDILNFDKTTSSKFHKPEWVKLNNIPLIMLMEFQSPLKAQKCWQRAQFM